MTRQISELFGKDKPSATYCWAVVVPHGHAMIWAAYAWFPSRKRARDFADARFVNYAIARLVK